MTTISGRMTPRDGPGRPFDGKVTPRRQRQAQCNCGADPGERCISRAGKRTLYVHVFRRRRARRVGVDAITLDQFFPSIRAARKVR